MGFLVNMSMSLLQLILVILAFTLFPGIPPDLKFESYNLEFPPLEGKMSLNKRLDDAQLLFKDEIKGPEDFAVYKNELYFGTHGGYIYRMPADGKNIFPVVKFGQPCDGIWQEQICGRPLGIKIDSNGILYAAEAYYGIKKVNLTSGVVETLVEISEEIDGVKPKVPNALDVSKDGKVFWTDSSTSHVLSDGVIILMGNGNGRVLEYDMKTKKSKVLASEINFPNGIVLSDDETFIIVAETFNARLTRYYIKGPNAGKKETLVDRLPGFPDNIIKDKNGKIYVSLILPSNPLMEKLAAFPYARKFIARSLTLAQNIFKSLYKIVQIDVVHHIVHWIGHFEMMETFTFEKPRVSVIVLDKNGKVIESLHSTDGNISHISSIIELNGYYYLGSPYNSYLGRVKIQNNKKSSKN